MRKNFNNCELNGGCADVSLIEIPRSCTGARQAPSTRVTRSFQVAPEAKRGRDSLSGGDRVEGRKAVDDCHGKYSTRLKGDLSQNDLRYHPDAQ